MASSFWTKASRACTSVHSVRAQRRSFVTSSSKPLAFCSLHRTPFRRTESSLAAQHAPIDPELDPGAKAIPMDMEVVKDNRRPFKDLKGRINYDTLKAITVKPFTLSHMSPVQAEVLPLLPQIAEPYNPDPPADGSPRPPRDLLVKAKTGTGKTMAFLVPAIEARLKAIDAHARQAVLDAGLTSDKHLAGRVKRAFVREQVGTLIISPTRELATQIANEALRLTHHHDDFEVRLFVGGVSKRMQMRDWMKGRRDIVVSTPGRLRDLLTSEPEVVRGIAKTKMLILDEADTLLDMGFRDDIEAITEFLPPTPERQTFLFSATVSRAIRQIARATLDKNHLFIDVETEGSSPVHGHIPQYHTVLPSAGDQLPHTLRLLAHDQLVNPGASKTIVFLPTTKMTQLFATLLRELSATCLPSGKQTKVYEIHSKRTQEARTMTSDAFRKDQSGASILVTSDISARGIDYPNVSRVIQIGIPAGTDQYIHRIGRTGRAGSQGRGDLVLLPWEVGFVTWQLTDVPLKPLTLNELKSQVEELAASHDADPRGFFANSPATKSPNGGKFDARGRPIRKVTQFAGPVAPILNDLIPTISELLNNIDEEAVSETFASLLGYYIAKSPELRMHDKGAIVQGCKDWATDACGLSVPPYVSEGFLLRLGVSDGRTKNFGRSLKRMEPSNLGGPSWQGRGMRRLSRRDKPVPSWASAQAEDGDPGRPEDFRGSRYGKEPKEMSEGPRGDRGEFGGGYYGARREGRSGGFGGRDRGGGGGFEGRDRGSGGFGRRDRGDSFGRREEGDGFRVDGGESGYGMRRR